MTPLPPGAREIDPEAEAAKLARSRKAEEWPARGWALTGDWWITLPCPEVPPDGVMRLRVQVTAPRRCHFADGTEARLREVLNDCLTSTAWWA